MLYPMFSSAAPEVVSEGEASIHPSMPSAGGGSFGVAVGLAQAETIRTAMQVRHVRSVFGMRK
jgi:hypothetical protein